MMNHRTLVPLLFLSVAGAAVAAEPPEASDPAVKRCADAAARRLAGGGFGGARAAAVTPQRGSACILRWEDKFSASNPKKVATLIVVPIDVELLAGATPRKATLQARCGFTDKKFLAVEILETAKPC